MQRRPGTWRARVDCGGSDELSGMIDRPSMRSVSCSEGEGGGGRTGAGCWYPTCIFQDVGSASTIDVGAAGPSSSLRRRSGAPRHRTQSTPSQGQQGDERLLWLPCMRASHPQKRPLLVPTAMVPAPGTPIQRRVLSSVSSSFFFGPHELETRGNTHPGCRCR